MKTLEELYAEREALDKEIERAKELERVKKVEASRKYRESITPEIGRWLLDNMRHICGSCYTEKDNGGNGFSSFDSAGYCCPKCALAQWLEDDWRADEFEMDVDVRFFKI